MTHTAETDAAFDRLSVPSFIRPALMELLAQAWIEGHNHPSPTYAHEDNPYVILPGQTAENDEALRARIIALTDEHLRQYGSREFKNGYAAAMARVRFEATRDIPPATNQESTDG